jgi:WD40 repeat protein
MARDLIFVSYSHRDEDWLKRLQIFLKPFPWGQSHKDGGRLWADPYVKTGEQWRREIDDALARTRIAVLLVSQDFLASDFITRDELPPLLEAAAAGEVTIVCVPVGSHVADLSHPALLDYQWPRPPNEPLDLLGSAEREAALARVFRKLYEVARDAGLTAVAAAAEAPAARPEVEDLAFAAVPTPSQPPGQLYGVPEQRPHHVPRRDLRDRIRTALLTGPRGSVGLTGPGASEAAGKVGVFGQGGLGKTVAAIDLVHDEEVRRAFPDGIYWLTLGQAPDLTSLQSRLLELLTGAPRVVESVTTGTAEIRELLEARTCLLVLDDVWSFQDARAFDVAGARSRLLLTTRDASLLTALGAENLEIDVLSDPQALALLAAWTERPADSLPEEAGALVRRCGYLPLAVSVAGAMVRDGYSWSDLLKALEAGNLRFLDHPYASVFTSLRLSVDDLDEDERARFLELAVAPEDEVVPASVVARLWGHTGGLQPYESRGLLNKFKAKGLLYLEGEPENESVRLHDLQRDFLQLAADDLPQLHARLLDAFASLLTGTSSGTHHTWWTLPADEPYLWRHLSLHLAKADRQEELRDLLLDYDWIAAKLWVTDINALMNDFDRLAGDRASERVQGALRLSAHVLGHDADQLAGQLTGRLLPPRDPEIDALLRQAKESTSIPWLRPRTGSLLPPGALLRILEGHAAGVNSVAVTPDGRRAVSASWDMTLKVWDLANGALLHTLEGQGYKVNGVAVTPDGQRAISASADHTLKVWDLANGALLHTLEGHARGVYGVAVTPDGQRAVSASYDETLKVWNLANRAVLHTLKGHAGGVTDVAVTPDGRRAVSASLDRTLKVWNLANGALLLTLEGHVNVVNGVAVTPDGRRAVSASEDHTLTVWDLANGALLHTLEGHAHWVTCVAVTPDGQRAISGSIDGTLNVWNLANGALLLTLRGHAHWVTCVAVTPDGQRAVSASYDKTLKVWNLANGAVPHTLEGHADWVTSVAVTPDGQRAVSASYDKTLKVWDLANGAVLHTLEGHASCVNGVAVTPDGQRAVSASGDRTLKVWDLANGAILHTLEGHANWVHGVAVTPDGRRAVSASGDKTLKVWDLVNGAVIATFTADGPVLSCTVGPDGVSIVAGDALEGVHFLRLENA